MHKGILSDLERRRIKAFNKEDGDKSSAMRGLATRCQQYLPRIREDLELIERFMATYESTKKGG